jgi:hypothetical protein
MSLRALDRDVTNSCMSSLPPQAKPRDVQAGRRRVAIRRQLEDALEQRQFRKQFAL